MARRAQSNAPEILRTRKRGFPHEGWQWEGIVQDLEEALIAEGLVPLGTGKASRTRDIAGAAVGRLPFRFAGGSRETVVALMGDKPRLLFPQALRRRLTIYAWDVWPTNIDRWASIFEKYPIDRVYFSCRMAARWASSQFEIDAKWLPEAINHEHYRPELPLHSRGTDLLELGRPFASFHDRVSQPLRDAGLRHLFPTTSCPFLFPDRSSMVSGIGNAKMIACFPASYTDRNGRSGDWESMTYRFLEAAASRTLIVGHIPTEMIELFGFTPGLSINREDWADAIIEVANDAERYQAMVDRAFDRLLEVGLWSHRAKHIALSLRS